MRDMKVSDYTRRGQKKWYDKHLIQKEFHVGQSILLLNSKLKSFLGKLRSRWLRAFIVTQVFPHGAIEVKHPEKGTFEVNG